MRTPSRHARGHRPAASRRRRLGSLLLPLSGLGCGTPPAATSLPPDDLVTVPAWVELVGAPDAERRGAYDEMSVGDGEIAVSFGQTTGFTAPLASSTAAIDTEERRTANLRTAPKEIAGSTVTLAAGVREIRETVIVAVDPAADAGLRSAAGAGGTLRLLDGRVGIEGEVAGFQSGGETAEEDNFARRLRASAVLLENGDTALSASATLRSTGTGYAMGGGLAPDWYQQAVGIRLSSGPLALTLDAEEQHNNLAEEVTITTVRERTLRPSLALSLDRLRPVARADGGFEPALLLPSMVRISHGETWHVESGGSAGPAAASGHRRESETVAFDWRWPLATTSLALGADSFFGWDGVSDGTGRAVTLSHSIRGARVATTLSASARQAEGVGAPDGGQRDSYDFSAAVTGRGSLLGDVIAGFSVHQDRNRSGVDSTVLLIDTTWQAKLALDLSRIQPEDLRSGALKFALSVKGGDTVPLDSPFDAELMLGLTSQFAF